MNFLFVHNNFPAQFKNIAPFLARNKSHSVAAIGSNTARNLPNIALYKYKLPETIPTFAHPFARRFDIECRRAEQVLYVAAQIAGSGFSPDIIIAHSGWGEALSLRAVFPSSRHVSYCELFYRPVAQDVNFDAEFPTLTLDGTVALAARNASALLALADSDAAVSPTYWQRSTYPRSLQGRISVIHEGVDTDYLKPDADASITLPNGLRLNRSNEIVTYVSRNLEPLRGYHIFMRSLPRIMKARPNAQILVVGGDGVSYGAHPPLEQSWKDIFLSEVRSEVDLSRLHFLGRLSFADYVKVLQVSTAHVYLTYPFVVSWSLVEAMSSGCSIVASNVPPVREVLGARSGTLVPFFDIVGLADQVTKILKTPEKHAQLGREARARAINQYSVSETIPLWSNLLQPRKPRSR